MKLVYPAIFYPFEDSDDGYTVEVPDLPGCVTEGKNLQEAILMGIDAASGWILDELENGNKIPSSSTYKEIEKIKQSDGIVTMLLLDMDSYADKYGEKSVRKNLTIPAWLNTAAEKKGVNFSQVLQEALVKTVDYN